MEKLSIPRLICRLKADNFNAALECCKHTLDDATGLLLQQWAVPSDGVMRQDGFSETLKQAEAQAKALSPALNARLDYGEGIVGAIYGKIDSGPFFLRLNLETNDLKIHNVLAFNQLAYKVCSLLLKQHLLSHVEFTPYAGISAVPDVPIAHINTRLLVTTEAEVEENYDDPNEFWKAGWTLEEHVGDQRLLARGLYIASGPEYLAEIIPHQWAMARAAKPGLTKYFFPQVLPEEEEIYRAGEPRLGIVGYIAPENLMEFSCALEPGQHIQGWEIFDVWSLIQEGALSDGRNVDTVRVVFLDRWAAEQEKRPLLDIGAKVYYYDDSGELVEIMS